MYEFYTRHKPAPASMLIIVLLSAALWHFSTANWIHLKALIAQQLLNYSWQQTLNNSDNHILHKPWPWADTWPVAKLIAPQHDTEQIVLAGDDGSSLAFAPGYSFASARPNTTGTTIISGHRDTHFTFLQDLKVNDTLFLQTIDKTIHYRVSELKIVDSKTFTLYTDTETPALILVTCYPFDAVIPGGPLRYLVYADKKG